MVRQLHNTTLGGSKLVCRTADWDREEALGHTADNRSGVREFLGNSTAFGVPGISRRCRLESIALFARRLAVEFYRARPFLRGPGLSCVGLAFLAVQASDAERYTFSSFCRSNPLQSQVAQRVHFEELMQIRIFSIGKVKADYVKLGEAEYLKRFTGGGWKIERIELDAETASANQVAVAQKKEADRMLAKLRPDDFLVVLDERGQQMGSESLAQWLQTRLDAGTKSLVFAIGGAYGWHPDIYQRADFKLSLSSLTFPYQLTRLILVEQLYRAYTINQGTPYHKA